VVAGERFDNCIELVYKNSCETRRAKLRGRTAATPKSTEVYAMFDRVEDQRKGEPPWVLIGTLIGLIALLIGGYFIVT
jgi:hypothetical protein